MTIECYNCKDLKDQFSNFVFCPFLKHFVDWEYWNGTCPKNCPKKGEIICKIQIMILIL